MFVTRWMAAVVGMVLALSLVTTKITGQTQQPRQFNYDAFTVIGLGNADCGEMTSNLRTDRKYWGDGFINYADGFLTGANVVASAGQNGNPDVGKGTSPEALLAAIEQYCGQHPLERSVDAIASVYVQLATR